jgi:hypothetical protein
MPLTQATTPGAGGRVRRCPPILKARPLRAMAIVTVTVAITPTSGTTIFSTCLVYATYMPRICRPHQYTWNIRGISMNIHGYTTYIHPEDIHGASLDIPRISFKYIRGIYVVYPWIYMVNLWTYIHGIYVVYPCIFLAFFYQISRPVLAVGLIQCAHLCW